MADVTSIGTAGSVRGRGTQGLVVAATSATNRSSAATREAWATNTATHRVNTSPWNITRGVSVGLGGRVSRGPRRA